MQEFAQRGLEALKWWVGQYEVGGVAPLEERKKERKAGVRGLQRQLTMPGGALLTLAWNVDHATMAWNRSRPCLT